MKQHKGLIRELNRIAQIELRAIKEDRADKLCPFCHYLHSAIPQEYRDKCRANRPGAGE